MPDRFLSTREILVIIGGRSRTTLWRWVRDGQFPRARQVGPKSFGWLQSEVDDWIRSKAKSGTEDFDAPISTEAA